MCQELPDDMAPRRRSSRRLARVAAHLAAGPDAVVPELFGPQRGGRAVDESHGNSHDDFPCPGRPPPPTPVEGYLAHTKPSEEQLAAWVEQFHTSATPPHPSRSRLRASLAAHAPRALLPAAVDAAEQ